MIEFSALIMQRFRSSLNFHKSYRHSESVKIAVGRLLTTTCREAVRKTALNYIIRPKAIILHTGYISFELEADSAFERTLWFWQNINNNMDLLWSHMAHNSNLCNFIEKYKDNSLQQTCQTQCPTIVQRLHGYVWVLRRATFASPRSKIIWYL